MACVGCAERVFVKPADLEQVGDLGLVVGGAFDRALVELDELAELSGLRVEPAQRFERRRIQRHDPERARMVLGRAFGACRGGLP